MANSKTPLICQSKLLCFSSLYLLSTLFLALYTSLSEKKCFFRWSNFDPLQTPLFYYPSSYGEHKHAMPTARSTCSSPVYFSDYFTVLKEIQQLCKNGTLFSPEVRYMQGKSATFGGNFSTQMRISYLDNQNDTLPVPCGFLKDFPVSNSGKFPLMVEPDRIAMEKCDGVVVVSAIFNDHDKIRQPKGLGTKTLENVCFFMFIDDATLKGLLHHRLVPEEAPDYTIGAWRIVKVSGRGVYENPAMNGVIPKYLVHRLFPNSKFSIWIDAKLQLVVDPVLLIHSLVVNENVDMAISRHPFFVHTIEEAIATARWKKWNDIHALRMQMETYCGNGLQPWTEKKLPYMSDVPDSALILRKHGGASNLFSCLMFNELEAFNPRDQLAFAFVRDHMNSKLKLNMFEVEVFEQVVVEYRHNLKRDGGMNYNEISSNASKRERRSAETDRVFGNERCCSKCQRYVSTIWGESHS